MKKIKLGKSQAQALLADQSEILQLSQIRDAMIVRVQDRETSNRRLFEAIIRDGNEDPAKFSSCVVEQDADGEMCLTLTPLPSSDPGAK